MLNQLDAPGLGVWIPRKIAARCVGDADVDVCLAPLGQPQLSDGSLSCTRDAGKPGFDAAVQELAKVGFPRSGAGVRMNLRVAGKRYRAILRLSDSLNLSRNREALG